METIYFTEVYISIRFILSYFDYIDI